MHFHDIVMLIAWVYSQSSHQVSVEVVALSPCDGVLYQTPVPEVYYLSRALTTVHSFVRTWSCLFGDEMVSLSRVLCRAAIYSVVNDSLELVRRA